MGAARLLPVAIDNDELTTGATWTDTRDEGEGPGPSDRGVGKLDGFRGMGTPPRTKGGGEVTNGLVTVICPAMEVTDG